MKKVFFVWFVLFVVGALAFVSCEDEIMPASITVSSETVSVPKDGGEFSVTYNVANSANGQVPVVTCEETWIHDIVVSKERTIKFVVDYNETEERSAKVKVALPNNVAETFFTVNQAAGDKRSNFVITVTETTESSVSATIAPFNPEVEYLRFCITKEMYDGIGSDKEMFEYFIRNSANNAEKNGMTLREYLEEQKRIIVGEGEYKVESLRPTTDYYICAVCIDSEIKQVGDMVKQAVKTAEVQPCTVTFDIAYEISGPNVTTTVTPSDENQFWVFDIVKTASIKQEDIAEIYQTVLDKKIKEYQDMFGWSEANIVSSVIASKGAKTFTDELDADTEYYGFAVSINKVGIINAVPTVKVFTTGKVAGSTNNIELNIIEAKDRQAEFKITTTNEDPYVFIVDKSASFKGLTDEQIIEKLTKYPYKPDNATFTGNQTKTIAALESETAYSAFVFGWYGGIATTSLHRVDFTTTPHVEGTASISLKGTKYFDGTVLSEKYPDLFPSHIYAGNAVLPVEVQVAGESLDYFYTIMAGAPPTPDGYEEYMYRTLRKQGHTTRTYYLMGGFDTEYTLTGFAVDREGHYGPILWEKITFTKDGMSPVSEFVAFE